MRRGFYNIKWIGNSWEVMIYIVVLRMVKEVKNLDLEYDIFFIDRVFGV